MDNTAHTRKLMDTIRAMNRCRTASWNQPAFRQCMHPGAMATVPTAPGRPQGPGCLWYRVERIFVKRQSSTNGGKRITRHRSIPAVKVPWLPTSPPSTFAMGVQKLTLQGRNLFFLVKEGWKWLVVADQFSPEPVPA